MTVRLSLADLASVAGLGLRTRPARASLSMLGVAIGIAAVVAVVGISESSRAELLARIDALGTNLLTVSPGRGHENDPNAIPPEAAAMIARIAPVQHASAVGSVSVDGVPASVRRSNQIPAANTGGLGVLAVQPDLLAAVGGSLERGRFLDPAIDGYPVAVLGHDAAVQLGVDLDVTPTFVWLGGRGFVVAGILQPVGLAPELDRAALIGFVEAADMIGPGGVAPIVTVYVRAKPTDTTAVQRVLALTANPANPSDVSVSRPSDALTARAAANAALTALLVGLGSVALLVGGLGIANVMIIAVLERRNEIGLRRFSNNPFRHRPPILPSPPAVRRWRDPRRRRRGRHDDGMGSPPKLDGHASVACRVRRPHSRAHGRRHRRPLPVAARRASRADRRAQVLTEHTNLAPLVGLAESADAVEEFLGLSDDRVLMRFEFLAAQGRREERVGIGDTAVDAAQLLYQCEAREGHVRRRLPTFVGKHQASGAQLVGRRLEHASHLAERLAPRHHATKGIEDPAVEA